MNGDTFFGALVTFAVCLAILLLSMFWFDIAQRDIVKQCKMTGTAIVQNVVLECKLRGN